MGKPPFSIGQIAPTPELVDQFFNDSTGEGDHGEVDARGPWNEGERVGIRGIAGIADLNGFAGDGETASIYMPKARSRRRSRSRSFWSISCGTFCTPRSNS